MDIKTNKDKVNDRTTIDNRNGKTAIIIGGSLSGLLTARVLSEYYAHITVVERDDINDCPETRKGQPQTSHAHALLCGGLYVLLRLFPGLREELVASGAVFNDVGLAVRLYGPGGCRPQMESGLEIMFIGRPCLEWLIRRHVMRLPNVEFRTRQGVNRLLFNAAGDRVTGVETATPGADGEGTCLRSDLVVDTSGRGSQLTRWLSDNGFAAPLESTVKVGIGYTTRLYVRKPGQLKDVDAIFAIPHAPDLRRMGILIPIEQDRWMMTLAGYAGDHCPTDDEGIREFAKGLAGPGIYEMIDHLDPVTDPYCFQYAASVRRHYENLDRFPEGLLAMGDSIASYNPIYGQGMSVAALQAEAMGELLRGNPDANLWKSWFKRAAAIADVAWQISVGADSRFPEIQQQTGRGGGLVNSYMNRLQRVCFKDKTVYLAFTRVQHLLAPPPTLLKPNIVWRVLRG
ncbi:MAG: hypothetical protein WDZ76_04000 [Pseudohongiellaceae bacterium]